MSQPKPTPFDDPGYAAQPLDLDAIKKRFNAAWSWSERGLRPAERGEETFAMDHFDARAPDDIVTLVREVERLLADLGVPGVCEERRNGAERRVAVRNLSGHMRRVGQRRGASEEDARRMAVTYAERDLPIVQPTMAEREERCARGRHPNDPRHEVQCNLPSRLGSCTCRFPPAPLTEAPR